MLTKFSAGMLAAVFTAGTLMSVWVAEASPGLIESKANETVALGTGICWRGGALDGWRAACDCRRAAFRDGVLSIDTTGRDGQIVAEFESAWTADVRDVVVIRARTAFAGHGDLFWIPEGGQESARYNAKFEWRSTGTEWCEYRVRPFWQGSPKIATLRIDFPPDAPEGTRYEFAEIRVERDKSLPVLDLDAAKVRAAVVTLAADRPNNAEFCWAVSDCDGVEKAKFRFPGDGRIHRHVIRLSALRKFRGRVVWAGIRDSQGAEIPDAKIEFSETPVELPGDLSFADLQVDTTLPRAGRPVPVCAYLKNLGDRPVTGVEVTAEGRTHAVGTIAPHDDARCVVELADAPAGRRQVKVRVKGDGFGQFERELAFDVLPSLGLDTVDYPPEPRPVHTTVDVAALYFSGWSEAEKWRRVWTELPQRKPALGWFDESNVACIDWQIKWYAENGISTIWACWFASRTPDGRYRHDHWIEGVRKARYRKYIRWGMMWDNDSWGGAPTATRYSRDSLDQIACKWVDDYFRREEYVRIDGKPGVWIWRPDLFDRHGGEGCCAWFLAHVRAKAKAAGFPGVHFISIVDSFSSGNRGMLEKLKSWGFDETGPYNWHGYIGRSGAVNRYPFRHVAETNYRSWKERDALGVLPQLPVLSTGWDDRPWRGVREIQGRSVADFRRICRDALRYVRETGAKRICLAPLSEWGEGSYAEPNAEFGFGFFEAVRETFGERPAEGWPVNYVPEDVGLGGYDLPETIKTEIPYRTSWDFRKDCYGMDVSGCTDRGRATPHGLQATSATNDPDFHFRISPIQAADFKTVVVRFRTGPGRDVAQIFWAEPEGEESERSALRLPYESDGGTTVELRFPVAGRPLWRERIGLLRFDPGCRSGVTTTLESIGLE